jgi:8-oxo-dGTP pyrophosphatase MutT (NUDIX family)
MDKASLTALLSRYQPQSKGEIVSASVMLLIVENPLKELFLLVTKRPDSIATYSGDYCFPGGTTEAYDQHPLQTAEREVDEELNLKKTDYEFIAALDDTQDRYGNIVRPFISFISHDHFEKSYRLAKDEVESIYLLPLQAIYEFHRDTELEKITGRSPLFSYRCEDVFIWGLTARIIVRLGEILHSSLM